MDEQLIEIFIREVARQADFGVKASVDLSWALQGDRANVDDIWPAIQNLLVAAGNVSKLLWPRPASTERGLRLRAELEVSDDSPLAPRTFRNHFEHFDERLEAWAKPAVDRMFIDSNIGPIDRMFGRSLRPGDILRHFDPGPYVLTFRGDTYHLRPVIAALRDLRDKAGRRGMRSKR